MSENMSIDELRAQLDVAEERWAHFETKCILLESQADDMNGLFLRFRALFGKDTTPEALQERLERATTLKTAAEQQCERIRQTKIDQSPLAVAIFTQHLDQPYPIHGPGSKWEERVRAAIAGTQQAMRMIADAGGLGDPTVGEVTVDRLKDEIGGLRQQLAAEDIAARENHECLSKIIGERTLERDEARISWAFGYDDGSPDACTEVSAWRQLVSRFGEDEANRLLPDTHSETASGGEPPAGDDPDRPADPSTPGTPSDLPGSEEGVVLPPEADEDVPF